MTKKAVTTGHIPLEKLAPNGIGGRDKVLYDGKEFSIVAIDLYEDLIAIDECEDGESICWKRTESIEKFIPFNPQE